MCCICEIKQLPVKVECATHSVKKVIHIGFNNLNIGY